MPPIKCSYFQCNNTSKDFSLFRFPTGHASRLAVWLNNCGNRTITHLSNHILRNRYLCITHFDAQYIKNKTGKRNRLTQMAVPQHFKDEHLIVMMPPSPCPSTSQDIGAEEAVAAATSPFNLGSSEIGINDKNLKKMERLPMCRICLVQNVRMYLVVNRNFHELYEKLTNIPFVTEDRRPILACFFCCAKLEKCCQFMRKCLEAEELFAQMKKEDYKPLINQDDLEFLGGFIKSPIENINIVGDVPTESIAIKEELPAVCEGPDDIIEPKEEHQDELEPENLHNMCLDVADIPPRHSESDLEEDVPLIQFKTKVDEEPEVPKKKRKVEETKETSYAGPALDADVEMEFNSAEKPVAAASSPFNLGSSENGVTDEEFDHSIPRMNDLCSSDDDEELNIDNDACHFPTVQERNVTAEPACDSDLTEVKETVLQREDAANDQALRDIVPDDCFTFNWSEDRRSFLGRRENFSSTTGPTFDVTDQTRPIDIFDKMFDTEFIDRLCTETNRYAEQKIALMRKENKLSPNSRFNCWSPTNRDEMVSFLAILVLQSLYPLPEEHGYFKFNGFGTMTYFAKIMSFNRFISLKAFFHFVDSQTLLDTSRLCKIRPVIDYFNTKFSSLYMPSQEIAIDEPLLKLTYVEKTSSKTAQTPMRTYELCESSSGYLWRFFVVVGKEKPTMSDSTCRRNTQPREQTDDEPVGNEDIDSPDHGGTIIASTGDSGDCPRSSTAKIVYDLMEPLLHRGHTLIMDNTYNAPLLLRCLKQKKTDCYGTLRLDREFVPDSVKNLTKTELRHGEIVTAYCSDLSVLVWRNANIVSMISTYHDFQIGNHDTYNRVTSKPNIVLDYNKSMGGIARKYQFLSDHPMERMKNKDWYKNLFRRLYNEAIFNCFVIFSSFNRKMSNRQFRVVVAEELLKRHRQIDLTTESRSLNVRSNRSGQMTSTLCHKPRNRVQARPTVDHNHFPIRTGSKNTLCKMCPKRSRTVWKCEECDVNLCIIGCFREYHKSVLSRSAEQCPTGPAELVASTSGLSCSAENSFVGPALEADVQMKFNIGAEEAVAATSSPFNLGSSEIGVEDEEFDHSKAHLTDLCVSDDDDELNIDNDACHFPTVQERNVTAEPSCDSDLTEVQEIELQREDAANDQALREILPDDCFTFNWSEDRRTFLGRREKFSSTTGPTFDVTDQTRPIDIFDKMFDTEFIDRLCTETNRYAEQKIALMRKLNKLTPKSHFNSWSPTNRDEMVSFLAILVLQSLYPLPEEHGYFKFNGFGTMTYCAQIMSYNRFILLKAFFHFVDSQTLLDTSRLCKIRPVIDYFNTKFSSLYMPSQEIAIDEPLLKLTYVEKTSSKTAQTPMRTYELCESSSGYLWRFFVVVGKEKPTMTDSTYRRNTQPHEQTDDEPVGNEDIDSPDHGGTIIASTGDSGDCPRSSTAKIVLDLMEPLLHRGHTLIMDNTYNSPLLLRCLKQKKTDCYGTLRLNRECVPDSVKHLTKTELRHAEIVAAYCSDLSVLVWRNVNIVSMISTYHDFQIGNHDKFNRVSSKPNIVLDYNKSMGGIARKYQFLSDHPMERMRNRDWYKNLFRRLYNEAIFNCFVIFSSFNRKMPNRQFRAVVAEELLKRHRQIDLTTESRVLNVRSNRSGQVTSTVLRHKPRNKVQARPTDDHNHFPIRTGSKNTCCKICPKRSRTVWKCEECDVNLCIIGCFRAYHKS